MTKTALVTPERAQLEHDVAVHGHVVGRGVARAGCLDVVLRLVPDGEEQLVVVRLQAGGDGGDRGVGAAVGDLTPGERRAGLPVDRQQAALLAGTLAEGDVGGRRELDGALLVEVDDVGGVLATASYSIRPLA